MGCFKNFVRNFVLRSDMFAAAPTLRYNGESSYESLFGGFLSMILVICFTAIFATSFINVLTKIEIEATTEVEDDFYHSESLSGMIMAFGIEDLDLSQNQSHFSLELNQVQREFLTETFTQIQLEVCDSDDWDALGDNFDLLFLALEMSKMLCVKSGQDMILEGFFGATTQKYLQFKVEQCQNSSDITCYSSNETTTFMNSYLLQNDFFKVNFFIVDTLISPHSTTYLNKVIENEIFLTFGLASGSRGIFKFGHYNVTTDHSIWPTSDYQYEVGHFIDDYSSHTIELFSTHYVKVKIQKSKKIHSVTRAHEKIDTMLSYVGGLFALLFGWLMFFIASYNQYKFQLSVAENSFAMDETGKKIREKDFSFLTYFQYALFDWMKAFSIKMEWKKMEQIDRAREEVVEQMDMKYVIKRLQILQRTNEFLLEEHSLICSNLMRPPTLDRIKEIRKISQYYDKVIKVELQQSLLTNMLKISMNKQGENVVEEAQLQYDSDFDSDDEEVQKIIIQNWQKALKKDDAMSKRIVNKVPSQMKDRLRKLKKSKKENQILEIQEIEEENCSGQQLNKDNISSNRKSNPMVFNLASLT